MPIPATPLDWRDALGAALRERRVAAGLTQEHVALETIRTWRPHVHLNTVSNLECGKANFTFEMLVRVVNEIDGDLAAVFARATELLADADTGSIQTEPPKDRGPLHFKDVRHGRGARRKRDADGPDAG